MSYIVLQVERGCNAVPFQALLAFVCEAIL